MQHLTTLRPVPEFQQQVRGNIPPGLGHSWGQVPLRPHSSQLLLSVPLDQRQLPTLPTQHSGSPVGRRPVMDALVRASAANTPRAVHSSGWVTVTAAAQNTKEKNSQRRLVPIWQRSVGLKAAPEGAVALFPTDKIMQCFTNALSQQPT